MWDRETPVSRLVSIYYDDAVNRHIEQMLYIFRRWLAMAGKWKASLPLPLRGCALAPVTRGALPLLGSSSGLYYSSSARSKSGAIQERELSSSSRSSLTPCPRCGSCGGRLKGEADDLCPPCCASELRIIGDGTSPPKLGMPPKPGLDWTCPKAKVCGSKLRVPNAGLRKALPP